MGQDVKYWTIALRFAGGLTARQHFLPGVTEKDGQFHAVWEPAIAGEDSQRIASLAQALPAACRALSRKDDSEPNIPPESVLADFIGTAVDALVRFKKSAVGEKSIAHPTSPPAFDSIHDQWIYALSSSSGTLDCSREEYQKLAQEIHAWRRPVFMSTATPFRLCLRLDEPEGELDSPKRRVKREKRDSWLVRYFLQDTSDPSLLVPAPEVWDGGKQIARVLKRPNFSPPEYLLTALGQASNVCPPIETSLKGASPAGYETDEQGAFAFLSESSVLLQEMGFGVLLPSWWTGTGVKKRLSLHARVKSPAMQGGAGISLDNIFEFQWQAALGDEEISLKELTDLAAMKTPLVKFRGQWVHIQSGDIQSAIEYWKKKSSQRATLRDLIQMSLGRAAVPPGFEFEGVKADGWIGDFLAQLHGSTAFEERAPHSKFQGDLRPYQKRGYSWLAFLQQWGLGACLADDMGLGKTIQTLALLQNNWLAKGRKKKPSLLVCPTSVVGNWQKEAERFTPGMPVMIHHGVTRKKGDSFLKNAKKQAMVITSYALLYRDIEMFKEVPWTAVILDEAQNIKNPETRQARAARSLEADFRIALTGTPVENNVGDLWSIMEFLNPGFLGTQTQFRENFFIPIQAMRDGEAVQRLKKLTGPFILRRLKTDKTIISDLPEKMEMKVFCNLTREQASLYSAIVKDAEEQLNDAEGIQRKGIVLATLSKLKQVCNHPAQFLGDRSEIPGRSGKLARLVEMLEEILAMKERALIFSQFSEMGGILQPYLQEQFGQEVFFLHGGTPKKQRDRMTERFQSPGGPPLFILSLKAGGTGLNLTQANHVFHFDRWWNPAVENQATDRAFRIGQTRNVQVHKFLCVGTLEERIDALIETKKEIAGEVVGTGEGWLTELSTAELKALFALNQDTAVV